MDKDAKFSASLKNAVCVDFNRIYDSCSDKDCLSDLRVLFPEAIARSVIDAATSAKIKKVTVLDVLISVEPLNFNKGFYSVDMTYYFEVTAEVATKTSPACTVVGVATAQKKAILFGSEGSVRVFSSAERGQINEQNNMPTAKVQVVDPICLSSRLSTSCENTCQVRLPESVCCYFKCNNFGHSAESGFDSEGGYKDLYITVGLFSIVLLERPVQMLTPCYDFCIPEKDCSQTSSQINENPCEVFSHIKFPVNEFFPPRLDIDDECSCGC